MVGFASEAPLAAGTITLLPSAAKTGSAAAQHALVVRLLAMEYSFEVSCTDRSGLRELWPESSSALRMLRSLASSAFSALISSLAFHSDALGAARAVNVFDPGSVCQLLDALSARPKRTCRFCRRRAGSASGFNCRRLVGRWVEAALATLCLYCDLTRKGRLAMPQCTQRGKRTSVKTCVAKDAASSDASSAKDICAG